MVLPTHEEINVYNSLDEIAASEHFLEKTIEQAEEMLREDSAYYQEDLMWMGPRAFIFYLQSVLRYLKSDYSAGDDHFIDCVYEIVMFRAQQEDSLLSLDRVREMVDYIIDNYAKYGVDENIYGDLRGKYEQLRARLRGA